MPDPKKNTAFTFDVSLVNASSRPDFKANPTLASGDFKVSTDEGSFGNLASLPTVTPASGTNVKIALSSGEMNGDRVIVQCIDQTSPKEWDDVIITIYPTTQTVDDLATQTSVNTIDDFVDTEVAAILAAVDTEVAAIKAKTDNLPSDPADASDVAAAFGVVSAAIAALNNLSAAQVNAEVVDALNVDTYAQPGQATPAATTTIRLMLAYLYKAWRNKHDQTATLYQLYNDDASTVDQKAATSDDTVTTTRGEVATGP